MAGRAAASVRSETEVTTTLSSSISPPIVSENPLPSVVAASSARVESTSVSAPFSAHGIFTEAVVFEQSIEPVASIVSVSDAPPRQAVVPPTISRRTKCRGFAGSVSPKV